MGLLDKIISYISDAQVAGASYKPTTAYKGTLPKGVVRKNNKGSDVKAVQTFLNWCIKAGLSVDGICGAKTVAAIKKYQKQYSLSADGIFGAKSKAKAQSIINAHKPKPTPSTKAKQDLMCEWAKKIANSGQYKYKRWKGGDKKTQQCPICKNLTGKYKGWNCIGFAWASWRHGAGLNTKCDCGVIANDTAEKMLKAKTDADAKAIAQKYIGTSNIKVIRNSNGIAASSLQKGDVVLYFKGKTYFHTVLYVGGSKVAESNTTTPNITCGKVSYHKTYGKVAIRYTGK